MEPVGCWKGKRVTVVGAGRSGLAAAEALHQLGAAVLVADQKPLEQLPATTVAKLREMGVFLCAPATPENAFYPDTQLVVTSPGVPKGNPLLQSALQKGIPIWSEIELAYRLTNLPIVAITGTNGKTTTTLLIADMLQQSDIPAIPCGNISADEIKKTLVEAAMQRNVPPNTTLVAEVSSFQLEWTQSFRPKIGVLTNITADHLDRYASIEEYAQTKARLFAYQTPEDFAVLNADDPITQTLKTADFQAQLCWFSAQEEPKGSIAAWRKGDRLFYRSSAATATPLLPITDFPTSLPGVHSVENVLAAAITALLLGATPEAIAEAVRRFKGVPHRMEIVAESEGVLYINNSMCTNIAAATRVLEALSRPAIVIAGGAEKNLDFAPLTPALVRHAKALVLIGEAADRMEQTFRRGGFQAIHRAASLEEAVHTAHALASPGDIVILSPACASFDMFANFEARGAAFRSAVKALLKEQEP
ncbi:UDP-N-acetylmuramoyl-L-alanine--D-glutamate ligase [Chthonomonas calidirosea]|uniref:UDP-N-acetylmuramoyl-L-alanine--D-glutamate ligase n=1 Tax=Chthonomonas calidirosea TaxID=454171 RepID=UPI0006ECC06F|nr:UDP-N-acetylmuramoyl-L-alanine--D-glutamate ligase [Chthonomonas calidirosea]CEK12757.1 UDP-N-acetylmuramoylalanine--D-glutamate ligase [Chthonomonas calidirosea]